MLERLTVAATLVVRHVGAYTELFLSDAEEARGVSERLAWAGILMLVALCFAIAMACLLAVVLTWNTAARLWTVAGLLCLFTLAALIAYWQVRGLAVQSRGLFARTAHAWQQDRLFLERLLTDGATRQHDGEDT